MQSEIPREIRQVRQALKNEFTGLIDMSDVDSSPSHLEQHFLSRALAAIVCRKLLGCDSATAAACIVDGKDDLGIDAIAVSESSLKIWLIQSKWSDAGKERFGVAEVLKFREGLEALDRKQYGYFNTKVQDLADQLKAVWGHAGLSVTMVVVTMGEGVLHPDVITRFEKMKADFNGLDEVLSYEVRGLSKVWQIVKEDQVAPSADLEAQLTEWIHLAGPFEAFQGRVPVENVSEWFEQHKERLFEQNIRKNLGLTKVNQGLVETLISRPDDFWYFNNGITVLCRTAERKGGSYSTRLPLTLALESASVVNGAQTVAAIHAAMQKDPEKVSEAFVTVKVVTTKNCPDDFGQEVTRATNTQNQVVSRDFVALDRAQWAIRLDFTLSLGLEYTFKRGEDDPAEDAGCSVVQAALALACAHGNSELAVRAKQNRDLLWDFGPKGAYEILFGQTPPSAFQIWRSVLIFRRIQAALKTERTGLEGRARVIADYGDLLAVHLVFRQLDLEFIDEPDVDWDPVLDTAWDLTGPTLSWLIHHVDATFGPTSFVSSTFANPDRCKLLVQRVLASLATGAGVPELPADYFPVPAPAKQRRRNAVPTLVDAGAIADGETLYFQFGNTREKEALTPWLSEHPEARNATWVNHRTKPLLWEYDGKTYSPTGLVAEIWKQAGWDDHPVAVQGPSRWTPRGRENLWELAKEIQDREEGLF
ncbi:AIPR family protein [Streptosporangium pseudovulgare]|uniref:Abortive infection phage resistance protein n=1 Tax=Streptosporangium pseudovulgare TaxID=35765 RepID=A0ABQ2R3W4_9ACTN|nr:AIPR family protein [Streptosporangium pseudovulgare]GGQ07428.1 putative abortive infection phage resistance protein [Streptosporangium pseudovulgare]